MYNDGTKWHLEPRQMSTVKSQNDHKPNFQNELTLQQKLNGIVTDALRLRKTVQMREPLRGLAVTEHEVDTIKGLIAAFSREAFGTDFLQLACLATCPLISDSLFHKGVPVEKRKKLLEQSKSMSQEQTRDELIRLNCEHACKISILH